MVFQVLHHDNLPWTDEELIKFARQYCLTLHYYSNYRILIDTNGELYISDEKGRLQKIDGEYLDDFIIKFDDECEEFEAKSSVVETTTDDIEMDDISYEAVLKYPPDFEPEVEQNSNKATLTIFEDDIGCGFYRYWSKCSSCGSGKNYTGYEYCVTCGSTFVNEVKEIV